MKLVSYFKSIDDLDELNLELVSDLIVSSKELSRFGHHQLTELEDISRVIINKGITAVLDWDILMTEDKFQKSVKILESIDLTSFGKIRVQDPGAARYIFTHYPKMPIQLVLETGHHNIESIKAWEDYLGDHLDRFVLSLELTKEILKKYIRLLKTPVEFLGLGKILLFYTPRNLLRPHYNDHDDSESSTVHQMPIETYVNSEESSHKNFPVTDNEHGTFMFNTKDHCLLENIEELKAIDLSYLRIDLREFKGDRGTILNQISRLIKEQNVSVRDIKEIYGRSVIRGFFNVNRTDALFKKLKNQKRKRIDTDFIGEVLEVKKGEYLAVNISGKISVKKNMNILVSTPDGKIKSMFVRRIRNSRLEEIEEGRIEQIIFLDHMRGVSVKSLVYKTEV